VYALSNKSHTTSDWAFEKAVTSSMIFVTDSPVLDDCDLLVCYTRVEHSRLDLTMPFNLYKQTIAAG
jgi:hypothetical protein